MALSNLSDEEEEQLREQYGDDDDSGGGGRFGGGSDTTGGRTSTGDAGDDMGDTVEDDADSSTPDDDGGGGRFGSDPTGGRPTDETDTTNSDDSDGGGGRFDGGDDTTGGRTSTGDAGDVDDDDGGGGGRFGGGEDTSGERPSGSGTADDAPQAEPDPPQDPVESGDMQRQGAEETGTGVVVGGTPFEDTGEAEGALAEQIASQSDQLDSGDVRTELTDSGEFDVFLTEQGTSAIGATVAQQVARENEQLSQEDLDVTVTESGEFEVYLTESGARRIEGAEAQRLGEGELSGLAEGGEVPTVQEAATEVEQRALKETAAEYPTDVFVDADTLTASLTTGGQEKEVAEELDVGSDDIEIEDGNIVGTTVEGREAIYRETADVEYDPVARGDQQAAVPLNADVRGVPQETPDPGALEQEEQFGDRDWSFGLGNPEVDEVEQSLESASEFIQEKGQQASTALFEDDGIASESAGAEVLEAAGYEELATAYEENLRSLGQGTVEGATFLADVPGLAEGVLEGAETVEYVAGDYDERSDELVSAADAAVTKGIETAKENPFRTSGLALGSLAGSYGIMRAARNVGPRTGAVSRYAIQPGEEIAGKTGNVATRAVAGERTAERLFPNNEPLIFSEEAAIRTAKSARARAAQLEYQPADVRAQPSRLAQELKSARFEVESALRSDAPVRMESDINTKYLDRIKEEVTAAKFKAAEIRSGDVETRLQTDRGQMQLGKMEARTSSEMADAEVTNELDTAARQVETETETGRADQRRRVAEQPNARVRSEFDVPRLEANVFQGSDAEQLTEAAQSSDVRSMAELREFSNIESAIEPRAELETRIGQETELDVEQEFESEFEMELETEVELEQELETELELEQELESRQEVERFNFDRGEQRRDDRNVDDPYATGTFANPVLGPGELGEYEENLLRDLE